MHDYETSVTDATADDLKSEILRRFQPTGEDSLFNKLETQARGDLITLEYRQGLFSQMHVLTVRLRRLADNCAVYIDKRKASEDRQSIMAPDLESDSLGDYLAQEKSESLFDAIVDWLELNYGRATRKLQKDVLKHNEILKLLDLDAPITDKQAESAAEPETVDDKLTDVERAQYEYVKAWRKSGLSADVFSGKTPCPTCSSNPDRYAEQGPTSSTLSRWEKKFKKSGPKTG